MILDEKEIMTLLQNIISENPGKAVGIGISGRENGSTRFANNAITTNGVYNRLDLYVDVTKGKKRGIAVINELNKEKIREAVARADALADAAPENPELMPPSRPSEISQGSGAFLQEHG